MNLKKLNSKAVKSIAKVNQSTSLSIEKMSKVMGGGCYSSECCAPNLN
ncbi:MAG: hypothetical protein ACI8ZM_003799 [Crocinitomix sp.]|jgi:hypothetical protein